MNHSKSNQSNQASFQRYGFLATFVSAAGCVALDGRAVTSVGVTEFKTAPDGPAEHLADNDGVNCAFMVTLPKGAHVWRVIEAGKDSFQLVADASANEDGQVLSRDVAIAKTGNGEARAVKGESDLRVLVVTKNEAGYRLRYIHFGIVVQDGRLFWVAQEKKEGKLGRDHRGQLVCTDDVRRGLLQALANEVQSWQMPKLDSRPQRHNYSPNLREGEAVVKWFDDLRQVGALDVVSEGRVLSVRVSWRHCPVREGGRRFLRKHEMVRVGGGFFRLSDANSSFDWEVNREVVLINMEKAKERPTQQNQRSFSAPLPQEMRDVLDQVLA